MKAVILAGGLGVRLKPFTEIIPKPLLPIAGKAVLEVQIEFLKNNGFTEIYLATNYKSDYIENFLGNGERYGVDLYISKEYMPLGTVGPITLLKEKLQEPFLMMNGDILTQCDLRKFYEFALQQKSDLTITIKEMITPFQFGNIFFNGDYVTGIEEKPKLKTNILAGIYVLKPDIFSIIPDKQYFGMDTLINKMLSRNMLITKYELSEYWLDIGQIDDYQEAQKVFQQRFAV